MTRTLASAARDLETGDVASTVLLDEAWSRIAEAEETLGTFVYLRPGDEVEAEAARSDLRRRAGKPLSAIDGIPFGVKDLIDTAGMPTEYGSPVFAGRIPDRSATCYERLVAAGAVILGKLRAHELGMGAATPPTRNPFDLDRIPGGSSGGNGAAVAAGMVLGSLGTDSGGSIRIPASFTGVAGLRPTQGLIPADGVAPLAPSFDTVGPMAPTADCLSLILDAIAEVGPGAPLAAGGSSSGLTVGVPRRHFCEDLQDDVRTAFESALDAARGLGWSVVDVELPHAELSVTVQLAILLPEASAAYARELSDHAGLFGSGARLYLESGFAVPAVDYLRALRARQAIRRVVVEALERIDLIATPTTPITAPKRGTSIVELGGRALGLDALLVRNLVAFTQAGVPSVSIVCGADGDGMPIGLQLCGRPLGDYALLKAAARLEEAMGVDLPSPRV